MNIYRKIGNRIKSLRDKTGMSQDTLAKRMKLPRPAISQIESGSRKIATDELLKISQIFHVSVNDLLNPGKEPEIRLQQEVIEAAPKSRMRWASLALIMLNASTPFKTSRNNDRTLK